MEKRLIFFIPGNPAVITLYTDWLNQLNQTLSTYGKITYSSYAYTNKIFDKTMSCNAYEDAMFSYIASQFKKQLELFSKDEIIILAHSAGSHFALKLAQKYNLHLKSIILMFPYIGLTDYKYVKYLKPLYTIDRFFPLAKCTSKLLKLINLKNIQAIKEKDLCAYLTFGVRQCVFLNNTPINQDLWLPFKEKLLILYTEHDKWCPKSLVNLLQEQYKTNKIEIDHDFILTAEMSKKMIETITQIIIAS